MKPSLIFLAKYKCNYFDKLNTLIQCTHKRNQLYDMQSLCINTFSVVLQLFDIYDSPWLASLIPVFS